MLRVRKLVSLIRPHGPQLSLSEGGAVPIPSGTYSAGSPTAELFWGRRSYYVTIKLVRMGDEASYTQRNVHRAKVITNKYKKKLYYKKNCHLSKQLYFLYRVSHIHTGDFKFLEHFSVEPPLRGYRPLKYVPEISYFFLITFNR